MRPKPVPPGEFPGTQRSLRPAVSELWVTSMQDMANVGKWKTLVILFQF